MSQNTLRRRPRKPKKFRFTLLHQWLTNNFEPCRVADVGGGKGTLAYLLQESGWKVTTIDPFYQELPEKYKVLTPLDPPLSGGAVGDTSLIKGDKGGLSVGLEKVKLKIEDTTAVERITEPFHEDMVKDFDLIIGMHLHGANMQIIKACKEYGKDFLLFPCCVIDEPIEKKDGINWRESLVEYATSLGHEVKSVQLNFKGKNIGIYTEKSLKRNVDSSKGINDLVTIIENL